jgi:hypothetical protein
VENKMQATTSTFIRRSSASKEVTPNDSWLGNHRRPISVPAHLFGKLIDFLEDKSGTKVIRRRNAFYCAAQQEQPIAWLNSQDTVTIVLRDGASGNRNAIQVRIEDIQLPTPIRVEHATYQSLLCRLVRSSGGGVVRWLNKFYSTATGNVLAELVSPEKIKIFEASGLFGVSREVELKEYAPIIGVSKEQYLRLLNFLEQEQEEGGGGEKEVIRIGNLFYRKETAELLRSALRSPATIDSDTASLLRSGMLAELVSQEVVRLADGTNRKISDLDPKYRVIRKHLYFCESCQSFVCQSFRATTHREESGKHPLTYISSYLLVAPKTRRQQSSKETRKFPEILYRFWGMEKGKLVDNRRASRKQSSMVVRIPIFRPSAPAISSQKRPTTILLLAAEILVDGHIVTAEEKIEGLQRLESEENGMTSDQQAQIPTTELIGETPSQNLSSDRNLSEEASPLKAPHKLRKSKEIEKALQRESLDVLPELESI